MGSDAIAPRACSRLSDTALGTMADTLREVLVRNLEELQQIDPETRLKQRYEKYRRFGQFIEG